ncbi:MAG: glucokinase [Candidatus Eisenbacteria bacterium]|nr:glucokinase [Candidatus Latescibacterota bacterium]MBD3303016.1 glucokinase [Candidatus Eisenbacteria bacterium]
MRVLAGDVGGTKTLLAIFEKDAGRPRALHEQRVRSDSKESLGAIVRAFLEENPTEVAAACFAVAAPIAGDRFHGPNLPWSIPVRTFGAEIGIQPAEVINDFRAVGYGLTVLQDDDLVVLQEGKRRERGPIALLGAGTGLGQAFVTWEGDQPRAHPSEGGHTDFAPRSDREHRLLAALRRRFGRVSWERVVSGPGLVNLYRFLVDEEKVPTASSVVEEMKRDDPAAVISQRGLAGDDEACVAALDLFASAYGAEAGNLALTSLATGGVYVAGGIAPKILEKLKDGTFVRAFREKGRLGELLASIPVSVIVNPKVGLLGAAVHAFELVEAR